MVVTIWDTGREGRLATTAAVLGAGPWLGGAPTATPRAWSSEVSTPAACKAGAAAITTRGVNCWKPSFTTSAPIGPTSPAAA